MVDAFLQGEWVLHHINKDEGDESLPLLVFQRHVVNANFSSCHAGIRNIASDVCYDDTKH